MTTTYETSVDTTPHNEKLERRRLRELVGRRPNWYDIYRKHQMGEMSLAGEDAHEISADLFGENPPVIRASQYVSWLWSTPQVDRRYGSDVMERNTLPAGIELVPTDVPGTTGRDARVSGISPVPRPYTNFGLTQGTIDVSETVASISEESVTTVVDYSEHAKYLEIVEAAEEDGHEINRRAVSNACAVFDAMPPEVQEQLEVFATYDGTAYVKARNDDGEHVSVMCQPDGRVVYRFNINNYVVYRDLTRTPTQLIEFAFKALKPWGQT